MIEYTGAQKVHVVAHSMGVTLSRAAIKGGFYELSDNQPVFVGLPINHKISTYIGIAGGNYGVNLCAIEFYFNAFRICNKENGFYPGTQAQDKKL